MDIIGILVWLSGAGISVVSAFVLERIAGFQNLSPNGKQSIAMTVAVMIAVCAMAAHDSFAANPAALQAYSPYIQIAITGISILIQQITHGSTKELLNNG